MFESGGAGEQGSEGLMMLLVITHILPPGDFLFLALEGPWILAGGGAQRNHRDSDAQARAPVGAQDAG